jgi:hypothetical protein
MNTIWKNNNEQIKNDEQYFENYEQNAKIMKKGKLMNQFSRNE